MEKIKHKRKEGVIVGYRNNQLATIDSREVAEMLGKGHAELLRDIDGRDNYVGIIPTLEKANLALSNYFIPSTYRAGTRERKYEMVNWEEKLKDKNVKVIGYATEGLDYIYEPEHDNWFDCIDELEDWFNHRGLEVPEYAYGSYFMPFSLDIDNIIEDEAQAYDEEIIDRLDGLEELRKAIEKFNKINNGNGTYQVEYGTVVKLFEM